MRHRYPLVLAALTAFGATQPAMAEGDAQRGSEIYNDDYGCIICHDENAIGAYGPNIQGTSIEKIEYALATFDDMMMWNADRDHSITSAEIADVAAYLETLKGIGGGSTELAAVVYGDDPEPVGLVEGPEPDWPEGPLSMFDDPVSMPEPQYMADATLPAAAPFEAPDDEPMGLSEDDLTGGM